MICSSDKCLAQKVLTLFVGMSSVAMLAMTSSSSDRVAGQLIDLSCYSENRDNVGNHHINKGMTCAQACAREGFEVGLLTLDGTIYHVRGGLTENRNARLVPYISKHVTLTGFISKEKSQNVITSHNLQEVGTE
jgi:hypothetical protein